MKKSGKTGQALLLVMLLFVFASLLASCSGGKQTTAAEGAQEDGQPKLEPGRLGVVFQDPSLYPWRTVFENVELGLEIRGVKKADRKNTVQKYLTMVGLDGFEHKYPHQLSGGMKQRAGLEGLWPTVRTSC
ncbi:ATP-binding cassette domain-containing protein [Paenibacillus cisolokensis]|uniref:ATP-binding cassette domain-containing protein n=1 Tax=Paenibacillus cisolokensis TaxID=1658519 RepID=UPI003D2B5812